MAYRVGWMLFTGNGVKKDEKPEWYTALKK
jgi:hypothetical protein